VSIEQLPAVNATLNATSAVLLVLAYRAIKVRRDVERHRALMLAAAVVSLLFLISYLTYHAQVGSVRFLGRGPARTVYFSGLRRQDLRHRRIARWTFPLWLYVSVTGVVIYAMLYHLYPHGPIRVR
jgi:uncharacterized membrane protein YozB (DUF420 family)